MFKNPEDVTQQLSVTLPKSHVDFIDSICEKYEPIDGIYPGRRSGVIRQIIAKYMAYCKQNAEISQQENCN